MKLKCVALCNWGIGRAVLRSLCDIPDLSVKLVVTRRQADHPDPWYNAVYDFARERNLFTMLQEQLSMEQMEAFIKIETVDLLVVHAYMGVLPPEVYSAPRLAAINIHPSLLPKYRGPAPTYWVLRNKEPLTGLTCHFIDAGLDTGPIIHQVRIPVEIRDTRDAVIDKMKVQIPGLLTESFRRLTDPGFSPRPQDHALASYAPRPKGKDL